MCIGDKHRTSEHGEVRDSSGMSRRDVLKLAASAVGAGLVAQLLGPATLLAAGEYSEADRGSRVYWARLKYDCQGDPGLIPDWAAHPSGDVTAIREIRRATDVNIYPNWNVVQVGDFPKMVKYPFIFMHGQLPVRLYDQDSKNITEYLKRGGFMFIDDCVLSTGAAAQADMMYQSMVARMREMLPSAKRERLDNKHEVFHNVFDLPNGIPHMQGVNNGLTAVYLKDRVVAMLCSSDIHCGWVNFFGRQNQQECLKMMVNIYSYAMTH